MAVIWKPADYKSIFKAHLAEDDDHKGCGQVVGHSVPELHTLCPPTRVPGHFLGVGVGSDSQPFNVTDGLSTPNGVPGHGA